MSEVQAFQAISNDHQNVCVALHLLMMDISSSVSLSLSSFHFHSPAQSICKHRINQQIEYKNWVIQIIICWLVGSKLKFIVHIQFRRKDKRATMNFPWKIYMYAILDGMTDEMCTPHLKNNYYNTISHHLIDRACTHTHTHCAQFALMCRQMCLNCIHNTAKKTVQLL